MGEKFFPSAFWGRRTAVPCSVRRENYTDSQLQQLLSRRFEKVCQDIEKKGLEIIENDVKIYKDTNSAKAKGTLILLESCGKERKTEHGDLGENNADTG